MIKNIVLLGSLFFTSTVMSQRHGCTLENTLFFSYEVEHVKAVEICYKDNLYTLTYGEIGNPDFIISNPNLEISQFYYGPGSGLRIKDNQNTYDVMGNKFTDSILKFEIDGVRTYQILDSRDENFINRINK